jgi:hypothetical protein
MLGNTALAPAAMFATQWSADHARGAKVSVVKLPQPDEIINNGLLLSNAVELGYETRIENHAGGVEIGRHGNEECEREV